MRVFMRLLVIFTLTRISYVGYTCFMYILDISTRRLADLIDACEVSFLYLENCANVC